MVVDAGIQSVIPAAAEYVCSGDNAVGEIPPALQSEGLFDLLDSFRRWRSGICARHNYDIHTDSVGLPSAMSTVAKRAK